MEIEIERRFLVKNEDWRSKVILSEDFSQAYLNSNSDELAIRVRIIDTNKAYITLKSSQNGLVNVTIKESTMANNEPFDLILYEDFEDSLLLNYNAAFSDIDDMDLFFNYSYQNNASTDLLSIIFNDNEDLFISSLSDLNSLQQDNSFALRHSQFFCTQPLN